MKVVVIGANGQLGLDIVEQCKILKIETLALNHSELEVSNYENALDAISQFTPDIIVNTAAMHNVDNCESNPELAFQVNGIGSKNLALISNKLDAKLIHISTDYVFNGLINRPYIETELTNPLNSYGITKLSGEHYIESIAKKYFILRTSALYGVNPCRAKGGLNFIELMLKLAKERDEIRVVNDEFISPTWTEDLAGQVVALFNMSDYGLYHATSEGSCSWYEFAKLIFESTNTKIKLNIAGPDEFPMKVLRPKYSVLENKKLKEIGINKFEDWQIGLQKYLNKSKNK